jgi:hypothetical protein
MKRQLQKKRLVLPLDAKMIAIAESTTDGTKVTLFAAKDGAIYAQRLEKVTYRILGGK